MSATILKGPDLKSTVPRKTIGQFLFDCAKNNGDKLCQIDGTTDQSETFYSVVQRSTRVAISLKNKGISPPDVVAFCTGNTLDTIVPMLATFYLGAKVANLEPRLSVKYTKHLLTLVRPKIIFVEDGAVELIENSLKEANLEAEIVVFGTSEKYTSLEEFLLPKEDEENFRPSEVDLNDVALVLFSSGTTGLSKPISHTHKSLIHFGYTFKDYGWGEVILHYSSFYWVTATLILLYTFLTGSCRVFLRCFDQEMTFKAIEKYKITTFLFSSNTINDLCSTKDFGKFDTSSLRLVHCAGSLLTTTRYQKMSKTFPHSKIMSIYGMTEVSAISTFHPEEHKDLLMEKSLSAGTVFYGVQVKIVDVDTGKTLGPHQNGEIRVKSICTFQGYYNSECDCFDDEGYVKTGDIGHYDEDGCLYVIDRIKEMFKYKSWQILPSAIERVLLEHPEVSEAVVFGIASGDDGEVPSACVVLKQPSDVTESEIKSFVEERVSEYERLQRVFFVSCLLKTPTGKYQRKEIKNFVINNSM